MWELTDGSIRKGLPALSLVTIKQAKGVLMVRRGRREETKSMYVTEYSSLLEQSWLVWILPLGRINCVRTDRKRQLGYV